MPDGFQPKSLDDILAGTAGRRVRGYGWDPRRGPKPLWAVVGDGGPFESPAGENLPADRIPIQLAQAEGSDTNQDGADGDVTWQRMNPDAYVFSNPRVIDNLKRLHRAIADQGVSPNAFSIRVSGGDRYRDPDGAHRSSTNDEVVEGSSPTSPHLVDHGARAADIVVKGVPRDVFERALRDTEFLPENTQSYDDGHTHVGLPNRPEYHAPK